MNPFVGGHSHAVTDCLNDAPGSTETTDHGARIGVAMGGFPIPPHPMADGSAPATLDQGNGRTDKDGDYHYHGGEAGANAILGCLTAQTGRTLKDPDAICDASVRRPRP